MKIGNKLALMKAIDKRNAESIRKYLDRAAVTRPGREKK